MSSIKVRVNALTNDASIPPSHVYDRVMAMERHYERTARKHTDAMTELYGDDRASWPSAVAALRGQARPPEGWLSKE
jgi:hypothetical protein